MYHVWRVGFTPRVGLYIFYGERCSIKCTVFFLLLFTIYLLRYFYYTLVRLSLLRVTGVTIEYRGTRHPRTNCLKLDVPEDIYTIVIERFYLLLVNSKYLGCPFNII